MLITTLLFSTILSAHSADTINKKLSDKDLTIQGITIGKTTLNEVKEKFKSKEIYHQGDAGESLYVLCYKTSNGTIAFESGEMGGAEHVIDAVSINGSGVPYHLNNICEKSSAFKGKLAIYGLSLGMSPDLIKTLKGKPTKMENDYLEYNFSSGGTTSELKVEFKKSFASEIRITKIETH